MKRPLLFGLSLLLFFGFWMQGKAQTDDLMIVEFVDWNSGSGFGLEIFNPTATDIDLATGYHIHLFFNGGSSPTNSAALTGIVPAGGTFIIGNSTYCTTNCSGTCDFASGALFGVNGNDAIVLADGPWTGNIFTMNFVDMVGVTGWPVGANGQSQMVNGTTNGLFQSRITRASNNTTRYTQFDGVYNNNTEPDSWPNDRTTNVIGWTVDAASCIVPGFTLSSLPVEMLYFTGEGHEALTADLSWATVKETNNFGFKVERSLSSEGGFEEVGFVQGAGNSDNLKEYTFHESGLQPGVYYYRLHQVDFDNQSQYSDVLALRVHDVDRLMMYPNPATDHVTFEMAPGQYHMRLLDARGRVVLDRSLSETDTYAPVNIDLNNLLPGIYHYVVAGSEGANYSGRLVRN